MTVPSAVFRSDYDGNDTTASYNYTFKVFNSSHLKIIISDLVLVIPDVTLVEGVDYTVTGVGLGGGEVILTDDTGLLVGGFLPTGKHIAIVREVPLTQESTFPNQGRNFPETMENALDYQMMAIQQQQDAINRTLKVLQSQPTDAESLVFPSIAQRAGQLLGFDSDGNPVAVSAGGAVSGSWQVLIDASNFVGARTLLGFNGSGGTVQTANIDPAGLAAAALANLAVTTAKLNDLAVTAAKLADNAVTNAKLADEVKWVPGDVKTAAHATGQSGWLPCDGAAISRAAFPDLFTAIGISHGQGDGSTTFNVPNYQNRFLRGAAFYPDVVGSGTASTNNATFSSHPYKQTGIAVRVTGSSLMGLSLDTTYYVIVISSSSLAFASTRANALAGTKISLSGTNGATVVQWEDPDAASRFASTVGANTGANVGSMQDSQFGAHAHGGTFEPNANHGGTGGGDTPQTPYAFGHATSNAGGNETRPSNIAVNYLIKT